jgi:D-glycero-D-manno-heptose 1,7-bisphosphate phosphatase
MKRGAVFLDRDGVLNEPLVIQGRPHSPANPSQLVIAPETVRACRQLHDASLLLVMVTNQPDIARGRVGRPTVDAINETLREALGLDAVYLCPHDDDDACSCRKPKAGMLMEAVRSLNLDLARSVMVGDRWRDVEAGRQAGCATVFVDRGYDEPRPNGADLVVAAFPEAVPWILARAGSDVGGR